MDITGEKVIKIVTDFLETFLDKLCRGCGKNNRRLLCISEDITTV